MRALYSLVMRLAQPFMRAKLQRRALAEPGYAVAPAERFGSYSSPDSTASAGSRCIWIHAVSLGETRAAAMLIARLRQQLPGMRLLLTHGTATGREQGATLLEPGDVQAWQPWDTPAAVSRFLQHFKPRIGILMETEVWPNLAALCQERGVPLVLANARLSEKSFQQSMQLAWLARPAYRALAAVWAQTAADADRLAQLGAPVAGVFGNLKFDAAPNAEQLAQGRAWRQSLQRPVILFASSREGEEAAFLKILKKNSPPSHENSSLAATETIVSSTPLEVQWLIVPRHPQRFDEVAALIEQAGFAVARRSAAVGVSDENREGKVAQPWLAASDSDKPTIWLGDSLGEMALYYGLADVALLGGSFEPLGGQNLIEAAACACPVVMGPHTFYFAGAAELAQIAGAALLADNLAQAVEQAQALAFDAARLEAAQAAAEAFAAAHQGATDKLVRALSDMLLKTG